MEQEAHPDPLICRIIDGASNRIGQVVFWLMLITVGIGAYNSIAGSMRKLVAIKLSNNSLIELQWYFFSIIFLMGAAYTLKEDAHVRVDVMYDRLSVKTRRIINLTGHLLFLLPFCVFMFVMSLGPVGDSFARMEMSPDPHGLPRYLIKVFVPVAFAWLFLQGLSEILKILSRLTRGTD